MTRRLAITLVLALLAAGCNLSPTTGPSTEPSIAVRLETLSIDCGPYAGDLTMCLGIVTAAAKVAPITIVPGTRATVSNRPGTGSCLSQPGCITLAASVLFAHVSFARPDGIQASADVVTNPLGELVGANAARRP